MISAVRLEAPKLCHEGIRNESWDIVDEIAGVGIRVVGREQDETTLHGHFSIYIQLLSGLFDCPPGIVYILEHDVLYPPDYFDYPVEGLSYAKNGYFYTPGRGFSRRPGKPLSALAGDRDYLIGCFKGKLEELQRNGRVKWTEPQGACTFRDGLPYIDIRHGGNFTGERGGEYIKTPPKGWEDYDFTRLGHG